MTMLAKYNSKINSPDIWLTALVLVISLTLANMNLENIEEASVNWIIQWFHLAGTYIVGLFRNVLTTRSCCIETGEIPMHQPKVLAHCHNFRIFSNSFDRHTQKDLGSRAWHWVEKLLRRVALAWRLQWSSTMHLAHPPQRQAVRMHLHPAHDCDTQFQKLEHREKLVHPARKSKKIRKNPYKLEHVANTRHGYGTHVGCSSQLVKINQKLELF